MPSLARPTRPRPPLARAGTRRQPPPCARHTPPRAILSPLPVRCSLLTITEYSLDPLIQLVVYDGPIVIEEAPAVAPFRCGHRPCCTDEHAHAQLCQANADSRREKWRRKQPRAPPSPPPAPRPPGVGRGTRMPAPRQVCYLPTACSRDVCLRCLSPLRLAGALTANRYKRRSMWCCVGRPKNGQRSHTPQSQQNKIACVNPVP